MNGKRLLELKNILKEIKIPDDIKVRTSQASPKLNSMGIDSWGFNPESYQLSVSLLKWIYTDYFRVETKGLEKIPEGRLLFIGNHGCQIPLDAMLVTGAMFLDAPKPRILRAMVDRWVPTLPFINSYFTKMGEVVGTPENCMGLLKEDNAILVFPEGTKGSGKDIFQRYQLQRFGSGFVHMAAEAEAPIIPVAIIGTEEIYPSIYNFKFLAKLLKIPYFPLTPLFPWFGPLGALPLPCKVSIVFGDPIYVDRGTNLSESRAKEISLQVKSVIQKAIDKGVKKRGNKIFSNSAI